jgi:hypothetical protein
MGGGPLRRRSDVRFGSKAAKRHVRFAPNSDRESGFPQTLIRERGPDLIPVPEVPEDRGRYSFNEL